MIPKDHLKINLIGRLALCSLTAFMISCPLTLLFASAWLISPLANSDEFMWLYRHLLALMLASGLTLFVVLFILHRFFVPDQEFLFSSLNDAKVHVGLTAYNDEICIGDAVKEFKSCPWVDKVVVVENNSRDNTYEMAVASQADRVVTEKIRNRSGGHEGISVSETLANR